jgi:hypothetical protein
MVPGLTEQGNKILYYSHHVYANNQCIHKQMHLIKYNLYQILISYMFRHRSTIHRESVRSTEYKPNTLLLVCDAQHANHMVVRWASISLIWKSPQGWRPVPKHVGD